jgi:hypothetical protein
MSIYEKYKARCQGVNERGGEVRKGYIEIIICQDGSREFPKCDFLTYDPLRKTLKPDKCKRDPNSIGDCKYIKIL